jgi:hypothetical protein
MNADKKPSAKPIPLPNRRLAQSGLPFRSYRRSSAFIGGCFSVDVK